MTEAEFERWLLEQLELVKPIEAEVKPFADPGKLFDYTHCWLLGKSGAGKTVLLHWLHKLAVDKGFKVIHRDDGGLGWLKLTKGPGAVRGQIIAWAPEHNGDACEIEIHAPNVKVQHFPITDPGWLVEQILDSEDGYHAVLAFEGLNADSKPYEVIFWDGFLSHFLNVLATMHPGEKGDVILSFDELNDLIQPKGFELGDVYRRLRAKLELHIRKVRKHHVKLMFTSHRVKDIPPGIRNNVDFLIIKKLRYMYDAYVSLNYMLVTLKQLFWRILARIKAMGPDEFFMIDPAGNWDFYTVPNLAEDHELPYYRIKHQINMAEELNPKPFRGREKWAEVRKWVKATLLALKNRIELGTEAYGRIAEQLGFSSSGTVGGPLAHNLLSDPELKALYDEIAELSSSKVSEIYSADARRSIPAVTSK